MWIDNDSDGCVYDTVDCYHNCLGCQYGIRECKLCGAVHCYEDEEPACNCEELFTID
jgi:hypothetical protein